MKNLYNMRVKTKMQCASHFVQPQLICAYLMTQIFHLAAHTHVHKIAKYWFRAYKQGFRQINMDLGKFANTDSTNCKDWLCIGKEWKRIK